MSATVFVDTNVLVYARDGSDEAKQRSAIQWMMALWEMRVGRVSVQVLQEYYVIVTRKLVPPRGAEDAREDVLSLAAWQPAVIDLETIERAWSLEDRLSISWWDALIFAAAQRRGCRYLLSEDFQDGLRVDGLTVLDPFRHSPADVLKSQTQTSGAVASRTAGVASSPPRRYRFRQKLWGSRVLTARPFHNLPALERPCVLASSSPRL